jgi:toxin ParE1/3/4
VKPSFRLTPRAYQDLKNIARYTRQQWGEAQRERYMRAMDARFNWLAGHPQAGRNRSDIAEGYFSFSQGSHVIFYQIGEGTIDIIGVPHKHMDVAGHLAVNDLQNNFPLLPEGALSIMPAATPSHWPTHHAPAG